MNSPLARAASTAIVTVAAMIGCTSETVLSETADPRSAETAGQASEPADPARLQARSAFKTVKAGDFKKPDTPLIASTPTRPLRPGTIDVEKFEIVGQVKQKAPQLGAPIQDATIYVDTATRGAEKVQSDDNGMFRVSVTYGEFRRLRIEAPGFVGAERSRDTLIGWLSKSAERRTEKQVVYLKPGIEVEGTVVADSKPLKDVSVRCVSQGMNSSPSLGASGVTNGNGSFRVGCPRERVRLLAVHAGYQHGVTDWIDLQQSPDTKPRIKLERGAHLSGRVLGADGRPLSQATLYISKADAPAVMHSWEEWRLYLEPGPFWRLSESDGSFDYGPVSGRLEIRAEASGATGGVTLDARGFDDIYVEIAVRRPGSAASDETVHRPPEMPRSSFELYLANEDPDGGTVIADDPEGLRLELVGEPLVTVADIEDVVLKRREASCSLNLWIGAEAGSRLEVATRPRIGERVVILIDGRAALAPRINSPVGRSVKLSFGETCDEVIEVGRQLAP